MGNEVTLKDVTIAYVMIKTQIGEATRIAQEVAAIPGVHWAAVVTGPYDVIAGVRAPDNEALGTLVVDTIHGIAGVTETSTAVMVSYHMPTVKGVMGPP